MSLKVYFISIGISFAFYVMMYIIPYMSWRNGAISDLLYGAMLITLAVLSVGAGLLYAVTQNKQL